MDNDFYGFREPPFLMAPSPRLYYASRVHQRAFAHLTYGLAQREGFIVVTGEVGAGKTTLIERLCLELSGRNFRVARISTTTLSGDDVLRLIADAFGVDPEGNKASVLRRLTTVLRNPEHRHLLIVDEAQGLSVQALEELRMLSNVTLADQPSLQTILVGQPQLGRIMASPDLDQLRQRVLASFHLPALDCPETHAYVLHRLRVAGGHEGRPAWDEAALDAVHHHSGGVPRRVNRLCSRVLLAGSLEQTNRIEAELVTETAHELENDLAGPAALARTALPMRAAVAAPIPAPAPAPLPAPAPALAPALPRAAPAAWIANDFEMPREPMVASLPPRRRNRLLRWLYPA